MESFDRALLFEHTRRTAEVLDTENLTKCGDALLELSTFQTHDDAKIMIKGSKLSSFHFMIYIKAWVFGIHYC
ncbi:Plant specific mitochondrial import receptor subunit TOM20 [Artemisia annua]|uniref:Plant specific mitochondrial import receptor subunit TOM20 n=1 Tax=Artemisia annua TaxID=35608 RepID=A0A2U1QHL6_ARTAN|nr:Plant specific mitochondrial import receptor subunit TOM20 [Artemisia annua]